MKNLKKWQTNWINFLTVIVLIFIILISVNTIIKSKKTQNSGMPEVKIGAGDDISGLVLSFMKDEMRNQLGFELQPYFIRDC